MKMNMRILLLGATALFVGATGCSDMRFAGVACPSVPINCLGAQGSVDFPPIINNLNTWFFPPSRDPAGRGYILYTGGRPECRLARRVRIEVSGYPWQELSCAGKVSTDYYLEIEEMSIVRLVYLTVDGQILDERSIPMTPDLKMINSYRNEGQNYGWGITIGLNFTITQIR